MTAVVRYTSSLRSEPIERTMQHARRIAREVGIVRVTDTTYLDRVGMPVFASIRPNAVRGSLCVSAGKGLRPEEAEVGAYMEGIELAFAEPDRAAPAIFAATAREVLDGEAAIAAFPTIGARRILPDTPIDCVHAIDVRTGASVKVPAELVVYPYTVARHGGVLCFGTDGNGICSGNSVLEAVVHGLTEVVERDATSFQNARDTSQLVFSPPLAKTLTATSTVAGAPLRDTLPPAISAFTSRLDDMGFDLWLRYLPNETGLPAFMAVVRERDVLEGIHYGYGCHLSSSIALVRAVTEAMQCRLSAIHGGRDDLFRVFDVRARLSVAEKVASLDRQARRAASEHTGVINFDEVPDHPVADLEGALALLLERLAAQGLHRVLQVELSPPDLPVKVVRVLVPGMEVYAHGIQRMGPRIRAFLRSNAPESASHERAR